MFPCCWSSNENGKDCALPFFLLGDAVDLFVALAGELLHFVHEGFVIFVLGFYRLFKFLAFRDQFVAGIAFGLVNFGGHTAPLLGNCLWAVAAATGQRNRHYQRHCIENLLHFVFYLRFQKSYSSEKYQFPTECQSQRGHFRKIRIVIIPYSASGTLLIFANQNGFT